MFNPLGRSEFTYDQVGDVCQKILEESPTRIGCYIFGPNPDGGDPAHEYERKKRVQLKDGLSSLPHTTELISWVRFPEDDMPTIGRAPVGPLVRQEIRLIRRTKREGLFPVLVFLIFSKGTIPELEVAAAFPGNSVVFVNEALRESLVGQDRLLDVVAKGAQIYFYSPDNGCHLRAFAEDFLLGKLERIEALIGTLRDTSAEMETLGLKTRGRRNK